MVLGFIWFCGGSKKVVPNSRRRKVCGQLRLLGFVRWLEFLPDQVCAVSWAGIYAGRCLPAKLDVQKCAGNLAFACGFVETCP